MKNNIQQVAFELFRQWTKNVASDFPELDFTIIDERKLVTDLEEALEGALNSLIKDDRTQKRAIPGYDYGFVIGFIQGKINSHWGFEYITKRSKEFKSLLINKALLLFLQLDTLSAIKVKAIYEKMYDNAVNLEGLDYKLPFKKIEDYNIAKLQDEPLSGDEDNPVLVLLKNHISAQLIYLLKIDMKNYLPNLEDFFSDVYVRKLIQNKENKDV